MKTLSKFIAIGLLAAAPLASMTQSANAVAANFPGAALAKINGEGFRTCKALGSNGYTAVARGVLGDGGGGDRSSGFRHFQLRTCFKTSSACNNFLDRIDHKLAQIEQIYYAGCKARS